MLVLACVVSWCRAGIVMTLARARAPVRGSSDRLLTLLDTLPHDWALITGEYFVHILTAPLLGMGTAVLYYALLERERARARNEPAGAGSS